MYEAGAHNLYLPTCLHHSSKLVWIVLDRFACPSQDSTTETCSLKQRIHTRRKACFAALQYYLSQHVKKKN